MYSCKLEEWQEFSCPIIYIDRAHHGQSAFQNLIKFLCSTISLWVIWNHLMVMDHEFLYYKTHQSTNKMLTLIAGEATQASKSRDYVLKNKYSSSLCQAISIRHILCPMHQIICNYMQLYAPKKI
jgi:hypothetical protein